MAHENTAKTLIFDLLKQGSQTQFHTRATFKQKKGSRAALRGKISPRATIGG